MHSAALSIFSLWNSLWEETLPWEPANFPNRSAASSLKHWIESDDQNQWLYKDDFFTKHPHFASHILSKHLYKHSTFRKHFSFGVFLFSFHLTSCFTYLNSIFPFREWNWTERNKSNSEHHCKEILFIKMLINLFLIIFKKLPLQFWLLPSLRKRTQWDFSVQ